MYIYIYIYKVFRFIFFLSNFDDSIQFNLTIQFDDLTTLRDGGAAIERAAVSRRVQIEQRHLHAAQSQRVQIGRRLQLNRRVELNRQTEPDR